MDEQQIGLDGQQINYTRSACAGCPVIFVHGNSSSLRTWGEIMTGPFGQQFRCLAFDLPGHGSSAPAASSQDYSLPGYADTLAAFADQFYARVLGSETRACFAYDERLRVFQRAAGMKEQDWTAQAARRLRDAQALTGRDTMREYLNCVGFKLR